MPTMLPDPKKHNTKKSVQRLYKYIGITLVAKKWTDKKNCDVYHNHHNVTISLSRVISCSSVSMSMYTCQPGCNTAVYPSIKNKHLSNFFEYVSFLNTVTFRIENRRKSQII